MNKKEEDLQRKMIEFQFLENNLKMLQEKAEANNDRLEELQKTKAAIEELKNTKPNKALIPLGSGNFVYGTIDNCNEIIVGIGSDIAVKKKKEDAIALLDRRSKEVEDILKDLIRQISAFVLQLERVQQYIEKLQA